MHEVGGGVEVVPHGFGIYGQQVFGIVGERDGGWRSGGRGSDIFIADQPVAGCLGADLDLGVHGSASRDVKRFWPGNFYVQCFSSHGGILMRNGRTR